MSKSKSINNLANKIDKCTNTNILERCVHFINFFTHSLLYAYPIMIIPIVYPYYFIMFSKLYFHLERHFHYNNHDRLEDRGIVFRKTSCAVRWKESEKYDPKYDRKSNHTFYY